VRKRSGAAPVPFSATAVGDAGGAAPADGSQHPAKAFFTHMDRLFTRIANFTAVAAGQPLSFMLAAAVILLWAVTGPLFNFSDTWQLIVNTGTTIVTFLMVFLIQNSQNRDGAAMQAKLDELLRAIETARSQFIGIEHLSDRQIDLIRSALEREVERKGTPKRQKTADDTVERLLERF
jgi:low affinity Fe/Cu permease